MRAGVGLTYSAVPESLVDVVDAGSIESVTRALPEVGGKRALAKRALGECCRLSEQVDAVAVGPGLSMHHQTQELVRRLVSRLTKPTVIDADGLNACAKDPACLEGERSAPLILTPHVGEMARLLGIPNESVARDRQQAAVEAARRFQCIIVMKGAPTFVAEPEGFLYLNPTGNSGMGSGGVGDVLTGIIVSLLAQGCQPLVAALLGTFLHGLAGDLAAETLGPRSLVASDIVAALPDTFLSVSQ
jgi:NAD(P)H-hydrate epimerase